MLISCITCRVMAKGPETSQSILFARRVRRSLVLSSQRIHTSWNYAPPVLSYVQSTYGIQLRSKNGIPLSFSDLAAGAVPLIRSLTIFQCGLLDYPLTMFYSSLNFEPLEADGLDDDDLPSQLLQIWVLLPGLLVV